MLWPFCNSCDSRFLPADTSRGAFAGSVAWVGHPADSIEVMGPCYGRVRDGLWGRSVSKGKLFKSRLRAVATKPPTGGGM